MKTLKRITALIAIMSFFGFHGFTQNASVSIEKKNSQSSQISVNLTPGKFIDNNKDGVCDNYQARVKNGQGKNYIDKNGDGICDNRQNAFKGKGNPNGCGMGYQHRHGQGKGNCCGRGYGYHHRHGCWNQPATGTDIPKSTGNK